MNIQTVSNRFITYEQTEDACLQEQTSLLVEDKSLPAEEILAQQKEQDGRISLFVP